MLREIKPASGNYILAISMQTETAAEFISLIKSRNLVARQFANSSHDICRALSLAEPLARLTTYPGAVGEFPTRLRVMPELLEQQHAHAHGEGSLHLSDVHQRRERLAGVLVQVDAVEAVLAGEHVQLCLGGAQAPHHVRVHDGGLAAGSGWRLGVVRGETRRGAGPLRGGCAGDWKRIDDVNALVN